jgi:hypothetical protein
MVVMGLTLFALAGQGHAAELTINGEAGYTGDRRTGQ